MKRLTDKEWITTKHFQNLNADEVLRRLWELENEVESGKYVELPCKFGDNVWGISLSLRGVPSLGEYVCNGFYVAGDKIEIKVVKNHYKERVPYVFVEKSEAEAKLKELKGEKE